MAYGIAHHRAYTYEVDHLIPLELGGSNATANLWPQPANPTPGYHQKDELENQLHRQVCNGQLSLGRAQRMIARKLGHRLATIRVSERVTVFSSS